MLDNYSSPSDLAEDAARLKAAHPHVLVEASGVRGASRAGGAAGRRANGRYRSRHSRSSTLHRSSNLPSVNMASVSTIGLPYSPARLCSRLHLHSALAGHYQGHHRRLLQPPHRRGLAGLSHAGVRLRRLQPQDRQGRRGGGHLQDRGRRWAVARGLSRSACVSRCFSHLMFRIQPPITPRPCRYVRWCLRLSYPTAGSPHARCRHGV